MSYAPPPPPSGPPPADPPLPPGWTRHFDPSGTPFYHNAASNATSWTLPTPPPPPPAGPPPPPPGPPPGPPPNSAAMPPGYPQAPHYQQQPHHVPHQQHPQQQQHQPQLQPYQSHQPSFHHQPTAPTPYSMPSYGAPAHQPPPYGAPPHQPAPYGAPAQQPPPYGAPAQQPPPYGAPSQAQASLYPPPAAHPTPGPGRYPPRPGMGSPPNPIAAAPVPVTNMGSPSMQPMPSMAGINQGMSMMSMAPSVASMGPGGAPGTIFISLEMKAVGLKDKDIIGKSDPICYVNIPDQPPDLAAVNQTQKVSRWKIIGKTECLQNTTSPNWVQRVQIPFHFEQHQLLRFVVIDVDNPKNLKGDKLGECVVTLAEIVRSGMLTLKLTKDKGGKGDFGELMVRAHDDNQAGKVRVKVSFSGSNLDKKDTFGKSDPYYVLKQVVGQGNSGTSTLFQSKELRSTINPTWEPHTLMVSTGGLPWKQVQLKVTVFDWDKFTPHDLIGEARFSLEDLTTTPAFDLINPKKAAKGRKYKNSGQFKVHRADAVELPNFISYLQGGLRLNFIVAVDFTASNKPIDNPASLHYIRDPQRPSQYAQALHGIGTILGGYIPDGYMTALGFGAILPGQGNTASFDFALTGNPDPRVQGVHGLLAAYEQAVNNVTLAGPTNFTPLIRNAMALASAYPVSQANQHFSVLLILTDGVITDLVATIDAIIECSYNTPMAIVIVGIGNADFSAMERLDGDDFALRNENGRQAKNDIVQFTKFDQHKSIEILAADVLHEVPQRVVNYMVDAGIHPNPAAF